MVYVMVCVMVCDGCVMVCDGVCVSCEWVCNGLRCRPKPWLSYHHPLSSPPSADGAAHLGAFQHKRRLLVGSVPPETKVLLLFVPTAVDVIMGGRDERVEAPENKRDDHVPRR